MRAEHLPDFFANPRRPTPLSLFATPDSHHVITQIVCSFIVVLLWTTTLKKARCSLLKTMASCVLSLKGLREQSVAKSNGVEYVRCSNRVCDNFCALDDVTSYEWVVQLNVARTVRHGDSPLCQHHRPCALRVFRAVQNGDRPYFTCRKR